MKNVNRMIRVGLVGTILAGGLVGGESASAQSLGVSALSLDPALFAAIGVNLPLQVQPAPQPPAPQQPVGQPPPPPMGQPAPPPGYQATPAGGPTLDPAGQLQLQIAQDAEDGMIARMIVSPIVGYAFGVVGAVIGALIMIGAACDITFSSRDTGCAFSVLAGSAIGLLLGTPLGTIWAASWFDGQGSYLWALLGTIAGVALWIPIGYAIGDDGINGGVAFGLWLLPAIGAMAGYELNSAKNVRDMRRAAGVMAMPTVAPIFEDGQIVGGVLGVGVQL